MGANVLVVDDNRLYRETFCTLLLSCYPRLRLTPVEDGCTALTLAAQASFDLIILDYQLQTLSGGDVARRLRSRAAAAGTATPPIILMSSHPDVAVFARTIGANAFLTKPVLTADIEAVIGPFLPPPDRRRGDTGRLLWRVRPQPR
jgi:CheY-like chemotaxis protein